MTSTNTSGLAGEQDNPVTEAANVLRIAVIGFGEVGSILAADLAAAHAAVCGSQH